MQDDSDLRQQVLTASTADEVAKLAAGLGYEFSGDELLRISGQKVERVTVRKQDVPGEYNWCFDKKFMPNTKWYFTKGVKKCLIVLDASSNWSKKRSAYLVVSPQINYGVILISPSSWLPTSRYC